MCIIFAEVLKKDVKVAYHPPNPSNPYDNIMQQAYIIRFSYVERNRNAAVLCCLSTRSINIKLICRCHKVIQ